MRLAIRRYVRVPRECEFGMQGVGQQHKLVGDGITVTRARKNFTRRFICFRRGFPMIFNGYLVFHVVVNPLNRAVWYTQIKSDVYTKI